MIKRVYLGRRKSAVNVLIAVPRNFQSILKVILQLHEICTLFNIIEFPPPMITNGL